MSKNRARVPQRCFRVSEEESKMIDEKMKEAGMVDFSNYARKMLIDGQIIIISNFEIQAIRAVSVELSKIGNNINQIARIANSSKKVFNAEIVELREKQREISTLLRSIITEHRNKNIEIK